MFSPYYHFSGRKEPQNHVCINVALYSVDGHRWAMTERGRSALRRDATHFRVGPSSLAWDESGLTIDFSEMSLPRPPAQWLPVAISGRIRLEPAVINDRGFTLDSNHRHHWRPIAPVARISVECDHYAGGGWEGEGYFDSNHGSEPLEEGFKRWDWSRGSDETGNGIILYDAELAGGGNRQLALRFGPDGSFDELDMPPSTPLKRGFWGVRRAIPSHKPTNAQILMELEDSPFYTRSLVTNEVEGQQLTMMHETFDGRRLSNPLIKLMLPFRMPRRSRWQA